MIDLPVIADRSDALSQPTRARLFALLSELRRPVRTAELAERLGLHPNGVRNHLARLAAAGLIERARERPRRGRPPDAWTIAPGALPGGHAPRAYEDLGRWLARTLRATGASKRAIEESGRQIGRELAPAEQAGDPPPLHTALTGLGFKPTTTERGRGRVSVRLGNCPYRAAARENQTAICALHRGITRGLLDVLEPDADLSAFVPEDPDRAGCTIELQKAASSVRAKA
jgi:predicted ArsR family transcriptional regulator